MNHRMVVFRAFAAICMLVTAAMAHAAPTYAPSQEAQEIAKRIVYGQIYANRQLASMVDWSSARFEWHPSPVPGLTYGVLWFDYLNGTSRVHYPMRFYILDRGRDSMVSVAPFYDANGKIPDGDTIKPSVSDELKKKLSDMDIPTYDWAKVSDGMDRILVFSDPDCPYCRKLHSQLVDLARKGYAIEIIYTPLDTIHPHARMKSRVLYSVPPEYRLQAEEVLAQVDSGDDEVLERALRDHDIKISSDYKRMVDVELQTGEDLAARLGVRGTPMILLPLHKHGIQGYATADEIIAKMKD